MKLPTVHVSLAPVSSLFVGAEVRPEQRKVCVKAVLPQYDLELPERDSRRLPEPVSAYSAENGERAIKGRLPDIKYFPYHATPAAIIVSVGVMLPVLVKKKTIRAFTSQTIERACVESSYK